MPIYIPLMDDPAAGVVTLDNQAGSVVFLAGIDRAQALEAFNLYQSRSTRAGATFDSTTLRVTHGGTLVQFCWETNISVGQDHLWPVAWSAFAIEDRLIPSWDLVSIFDGIVNMQ